MKIVVTGGAGYVGTELTAKLAANPGISEIVIYDNLSRGQHSFFLAPRISSGKIRFVHGELLDSRKLRKAIEGAEVVYHLAAKVTTPFANQDAHSFEQVNQWGTAELSYILEDSSLDVKTVVFASSTSVYGSSAGKLVDEEVAPNPKTYYGISKMLAEDMIRRLLGTKLRTFIVRLGNVYGHSKSMRFDAVINRFMFNAHFNGKITVQGNGKQLRSFVSVDNAAHALSELIRREDIPQGTYNLATHIYSVNELAELIRQVYPSIDVQYVQQSLTLKSLAVDPHSGLNKYGIITPTTDILEDLRKIKENFAF